MTKPTKAELVKLILGTISNWPEDEVRQLYDWADRRDRQILSGPEEATPMHTLEEAGIYFITGWNQLAERVHNTTVSKGFWEEGNNRNKGELLALMHSELSEALEALRHGNPPDNHIPNFSGVEAEMADLLIRVMDAGKQFGWNVTGALLAKMIYNEGRPPKHGKKF